jgi:hypothetical protein
VCRFEKLDITPKSAQKIKPVLEKWMHEIDEKITLGLFAPSSTGSQTGLGRVWPKAGAVWMDYVVGGVNGVTSDMCIDDLINDTNGGPTLAALLNSMLARDDDTSAPRAQVKVAVRRPKTTPTPRSMARLAHSTTTCSTHSACVSARARIT